MILKRSTSEVIFESVVAAILAVGISIILIHFDVFELWYQFSRTHEGYQLDEALGIVMAVTLAGTFLALRHIYVLRHLMRELEEANKTLQHQEKVKGRLDKLAALGELSTGLAHEINNALQPAIGLGSFIKEGLRESGNMKHYAFMETILNSAQHAQHVIQNVLVYTQEKNTGLTHYDAATVLDQALHFAMDLMPTTIKFDLEGFKVHKHPSHNPLSIRVNKTSLCQIFLNLMKNATKAMDNAGTIHVAFDTGAMPDSKHTPAVVVQVTDSGHGMDEETVRKVFDPFFTTSDISEGTGLGLSVVYGLMHQQRGAITVSSIKGHGSTFTLYFPSETQRA